MTVTQYIGARYVPKFNEPLEWDFNKGYEPLTIVYHGGNSYTSKQSVPPNVQIDNEDYWALTGNYNAQIEQYRKEVKNVETKLDTFDTSIKNNTATGETNKTNIEDAKTDIEVLKNKFPLKTVDISDGAVKLANLSPEANEIIETTRQGVETNTADIEAIKNGGIEDLTTIKSDVAENKTKIEANKTSLETLKSKFPIKTADIENSSVTFEKLTPSAVSYFYKNLKIRRFGLGDIYTDNAGMQVSSNVYNFEGWYMPELELLCIQRLEVNGYQDTSIITEPINIVLPDYVPSISDTIYIGMGPVGCGFTEFTFTNWLTMRFTGRTLQTNAVDKDLWWNLAAPCIVSLKGHSASNATPNAQNAIAENGFINE